MIQCQICKKILDNQFMLDLHMKYVHKYKINPWKLLLERTLNDNI